MKQPGRVLLIEDDTIAQRIPILLFESKDWQVDVAANGAQALTAIQQACYDIILLDIGLPDIHGVALAQQMRRELKYYLPIIGLSAHADKECLTNNAIDEMYPKPFTMSLLEYLLEKYFSNTKYSFCYSIK